MIRALALLLALAIPGAAAALTAEEMEGEWERIGAGGNTCAENPATLRVSRGPDRVMFSWPEPMPVFDGTTRTSVTYRLIAEGADTLTVALDGETRMTEAGDPVVWLMWTDPARSVFCWNRTDRALGDCDGVYRRCPNLAPRS